MVLWLRSAGVYWKGIAMADAEPLVTVATFNTLVEAEMARNCLEAEAIQCFVADGEVASMAWYATGAIGGVKLQVAKTDFLAAERILNNRRGHGRDWNLDDYGLAKSTAITADPEVVRQTPAPKFEEPEETIEPSEADRTLDRALKAAIFGLVLFPPLLHFYSTWLLFELAGSGSSLSASKRAALFLTIAINVAMLLGVLFIGQLCLVGPVFW
jgi:hypothetical protein